MRRTGFSRHAWASAVVLACLGANGALAADEARLPPVFTFSVGYKTGGPASKNVVELGVITECGKGARCMDVRRYDSDTLLPRVPTRYNHDLHAPYGTGMCTNGPVMTIQGRSDSAVKVRLQPTQDGFAVSFADFRYRWVVDSKVRDGYKLAEVSHDDTPLDQAVGFAFVSDKEMKGDIRKADLASYFKGEIFHKTALDGLDRPWTYAPSSFDFRKYDEAENGHLLLRSLPGDARVVKKYGKPMWVQSSIVLQRGPEKIAPLIEEYGHDFTMDGCFNEFGHNKMLLPVGTGNVSALIYVEYTPDKQRGFPMISVGRYYR